VDIAYLIDSMASKMSRVDALKQQGYPQPGRFPS